MWLISADKWVFREEYQGQLANPSSHWWPPLARVHTVHVELVAQRNTAKFVSLMDSQHPKLKRQRKRLK